MMVSQPAVDFREIESSDTFELFARDFFETLGLQIVEPPARGPDLGRDLVIEDLLRGQLLSDSTRWIVSAKHNAHSGKAVRESDEIDAKGRTDSAGAVGFIGFYSTLPSTGLRDRLRGLSIKVEIFDAGRIANYLITTPALTPVFQQYFPRSWRALHPVTEFDFVVTAETDPMRPDEHVVIELASLLRDARQQMRFADPRVERVVVAAVLASEIREGRVELLSRFISFEPGVFRYLVRFLQDEKPDDKIVASLIRATNEPFLLRNLVSLAGALRLTGCVETICEKVLTSGRYDKALAERGYSFGISGFSDVARRSLTNLGTAILPQLEEHRIRARASRQWKAKAIFEGAKADIARRSHPSAV
ncbi:MAG TPA: hypothetical protein VJV21_07985 [Pyrinomonadaceae bacterium]|nr:hypothetical protein [Pyrinomonadaceae bacterium]